MSEQNIFDDSDFYLKYETVRQKDFNANELMEKPTLFKLLPDLTDKKVLELGCGHGVNSKDFLDRGAKQVVGIDISTRMIAKAKAELEDPRVRYMRMPMESMLDLGKVFDVVVSSLAIHYVEDLNHLLKNVYCVLSDEGYLVFTQEHPMVTAYTGGERWVRNLEGGKLAARIDHYSLSGKRTNEWLDKKVVKYHRTMADILNAFVKSGFKLEEVIEPYALEEDYRDTIHRPDFIGFKLSKLK